MAATKAKTRTALLAVLVTFNLLEDFFPIHRMLEQRFGLHLYYFVDISLYVFTYTYGRYESAWKVRGGEALAVSPKTRRPMRP